ncbi:MAG: urease accessory protein UreD, partial [Clostridiales bacterium]|nr:urease accessory protein UreD [Clostridiales bacterium]
MTADGAIAGMATSGTLVGMVADGTPTGTTGGIPTDAVAGMVWNRYPRPSEVFLRARMGAGGRSGVEDVSFTAPFKVTNPFCGEGDGGGLQVMLLSVSAGLLAGDAQQICVEVGENADLEVLSQAYEKIHGMDAGGQA